MYAFTFIVAFEVPEGKEEKFRGEWHAVVERLRHAPGAAAASGALYEVNSEIEENLQRVPGISAALRARADSKARFRFVMIAQWPSLSGYKSVIRASAQAPGEAKPISFLSHGAYYRIAAEYTGPDLKECDAPRNLTFINLFEVPEGEEEGFGKEWHEVAKGRREAPGFLRARLYEVDSTVEEHLLGVPGISAVLRARPDSKARFRFVMVAEWASLSGYEEAIHSPGQKPISFRSHPGFYKIAAG